ncbi:MAG: hypothetical protein DELT_01925 [Desulfovibrio sp.]
MQATNFFTALKFSAVLALALMCFACAHGNVVHLSYPIAPEASAIPPKNIRVCVVDFKNNRQSGAIGERLNGEKLMPRTPVERWLASALANELRYAGYQAVVTETYEEALESRPDYIVTGNAEEVWLSETSRTRYTGTVRARISLRDGKGGYITQNEYNSVYSKTSLPVYGVPQSLLGEALVEMLQPASRLLARIMQ